MTIGIDEGVSPTLFRRTILAVTALTCLVAGVVLVAILLTALFGGEGESPVALALIGGGAAVTVLHALALGYMLLRRGEHRLLRSAVLIGGIALLAASGAVVIGAELDNAPGGVLAGLLLAAQGGAAVLSVAFPQLVAPRSTRA
jgi:hypothetical protein